MIVYESPRAKVEWLETHKLILKQFTGFVKDEELRSAFNAGHAQLKKGHGNKWLSDNRGLPVYTREDIEWINEDWFPRMQQAGWKYWALVEPQSVIGTMTMRKFQFYIDQGITLQTFTKLGEALNWLASMK